MEPLNRIFVLLLSVIVVQTATCYVIMLDCNREYEIWGYIKCTGSGGQSYAFVHEMISHLEVNGDVSGLDLTNIPNLARVEFRDICISCANIVGNKNAIILVCPEKQSTCSPTSTPGESLSTPEVVTSTTSTPRESTLTQEVVTSTPREYTPTTEVVTSTTRESTPIQEDATSTPRESNPTPTESTSTSEVVTSTPTESTSTSEVNTSLTPTNHDILTSSTTDHTVTIAIIPLAIVLIIVGVLVVVIIRCKRSTPDNVMELSVLSTTTLHPAPQPVLTPTPPLPMPRTPPMLPTPPMPPTPPTPPPPPALRKSNRSKRAPERYSP